MASNGGEDSVGSKVEARAFFSGTTGRLSGTAGAGVGEADGAASRGLVVGALSREAEVGETAIAGVGEPGVGDGWEAATSRPGNDAAVSGGVLCLTGRNEVIPSQMAAATTTSAMRKRKNFFINSRLAERVLPRNR